MGVARKRSGRGKLLAAGDHDLTAVSSFGFRYALQAIGSSFCELAGYRKLQIGQIEGAIFIGKCFQNPRVGDGRLRHRKDSLQAVEKLAYNIRVEAAASARAQLAILIVGT